MGCAGRGAAGWLPGDIDLGCLDELHCHCMPMYRGGWRSLSLILSTPTLACNVSNVNVRKTSTLHVPRPLLSTFHHARCRARKMLVGHRPEAIFRAAIWLLSGVTGSSSLGDLFCWRYGDLTESVPVHSRTTLEHQTAPVCTIQF